MRHFDPEAMVRLCWRGVSLFRYLRDNLLLTWMHTRLFIGFVSRLPLLLIQRGLGRI